MAIDCQLVKYSPVCLECRHKGKLCQTLMWLFCVSHCSANGESRHPARLQWKRWRSLDEEKRTSWYTVEDKGDTPVETPTGFMVGQEAHWRAGNHIAVHLRRSTHTHTHNFSPTNETFPTHPHLACPASLWQRQQLSDISFHYCSTPCLHHCSALDEARSTVNCQAELIGTWGRRREWLGNWNELEWKKRL